MAAAGGGEDDKFGEERSARLMAVAEKPYAAFPRAKLSLPADGVKAGDALVAVVACGSFSPVTNMHLRMFEMARDLIRSPDYRPPRHERADPKGPAPRAHFFGAFLSPVTDAYGKKGLAEAKHRVAMCDAAVEDSPHIMVDHWESEQTEYFPTFPVLVHFLVNLKLAASEALSPLGLKLEDVTLQVQLLCGTDLLESFNTPGVWAPSDIEAIVRDFGLICIQRDGQDGEKLVFNHDVLYEHRANIYFVRQWISNDLSSTRIRQACARGMSIRYLTPNPVIDYILEHGLYGAKKADAKL